MTLSQQPLKQRKAAQMRAADIQVGSIACYFLTGSQARDCFGGLAAQHLTSKTSADSCSTRPFITRFSSPYAQTSTPKAISAMLAATLRSEPTVKRGSCCGHRRSSFAAVWA